MVRELSAKGVQARRCCAHSALPHPRAHAAAPDAARVGARQVPDGFATTAEAFRLFLSENGLDSRIKEALDALDVSDTKARAPRCLARASGVQRRR